MEIIKAEISHADLVGKIHSRAWMQAYKDLFPTEYLNQESALKRKEEFLNAQNEHTHYFLIMEDGICAGLFKFVIYDGICELSSIYILKEHCHKGYGTACINYIKTQYPQYRIVLWTLEENLSARNFYEKNHFYYTGNRRVIDRGREYIQVQYAL